MCIHVVKLVKKIFYITLVMNDCDEGKATGGITGNVSGGG